MSTLLNIENMSALTRAFDPGSLALREKIQAHCLDEAAVSDPFSARLAREQRWSAEYTLGAITEYKRFVFLAVTTPERLTPSDAVDQVWHLHLCYTHDYWTVFCGQVLERSLHHRPGRGGAQEREQYTADYARTLERYREVFDCEPPADFWPPASDRFESPAAFARVNLAEHLIVRRSWMTAGALLLAVLLAPWLWVGLSELQGIRFAQLVGLLGAAAFAVAWARRRQRVTPSGTAPLELDAFEAALLKGGPRTATEAVIAELVVKGCLTYRDDALYVGDPIHDTAHPFERVAWEKVRGDEPVPLRDAYSAIVETTQDLTARLQGLGLTTKADWIVPWPLALAAPSVCAAKLAVSHGPAGPFTIGLVVIGFILAFAFFANGASTTQLGTEALAQFRRQHPIARCAPHVGGCIAPGQLAAEIAISGSEALKRHGLDALADALAAARSPLPADEVSRAGSCGGCGCG